MILWQILAMEVGAPEFEAHPGRGRFNAAFFHVMDGYINWLLRKQKEAVYADLPRIVVEIGSGVGANFRYMQRGTKVIAVEPNPYMHRSLRLAAQRHEIELEIRDVVGERIDLPDSSADTVISSLVLCTVANPSRVVSEVHRVLRPGGRYSNTLLPRRARQPVGFSGWFVGHGHGCSRVARVNEISKR